MKEIVERLVDLIGETSSSLPEDVLAALRRARLREKAGSSARLVLSTILENCDLAARRGTPLCQDTGTLAFFVAERLRRTVTPQAIARATRLATRRGCLRKNTLEPLSGHSYDDNVCPGAPVVRYGEQYPGVTLLMKGGGSENMSRQYSLPDASLGAGRDLEGVRRCVLCAVQEIQGYGCAPGILGVVVGGDRASAYEAAKEQLLRPLDEPSATPFESKLLREANRLGVGPMGLGGKTTLLGVKMTTLPRVPASFFVTIAYMCWACRRRTIRI